MDEEDTKILAQVKEALSKSPAWDESGFLRLSVYNWVPLSTASKAASTDCGLYTLGLPVGLSYDQGNSRIVYLGSAKNIKKRLARHKSKPQNDMVALLQEKFSEGLSATWWPIPGFNRKFLYGIEGEALWTFEETFGTLPICNTEIPEFFEGEEYCKGLVRILPCQIDHLITLNVLADRIGRVLVREELGGTTLVFGGIPDGTVRTKFKTATFLRQKQIDRETKRQEEQERLRVSDEEFEKHMQPYEFALIHDVNLAAWSVDKMREVIRLCNQLKPKKTRAKVIKPFEAPFRKVPEPHTWGEVALIKARMVAGSWQPGKQVRVKVMHGKEMLGEGKLNKGWCVGEDRSDMPQRKTERPECKDYESKIEPVECLHEEEEIYGLKISNLKLGEVMRVEQQIREELQQTKKRLWTAVEDLFREAMERNT